MNILDMKTLAGSFRSVPANAVYVGFRPESASLLDCAVAINDINIPGEMIAREMLGDQTLYKFKTQWGQIYVKSVDGRMVEYGSMIISVEYEKIYFFDSGGNAIKKAFNRELSAVIPLRVVV